MSIYDTKEFGNRLKYLRKRNRMTQEQLAEKLYITSTSVSNFENGKTICMHEHIVKICQIFNISADYLFFGKNLSEEGNDYTRKIKELLDKKDEFDKEKAYQMLVLLFEQSTEEQMVQNGI